MQQNVLMLVACIQTREAAILYVDILETLSKSAKPIYLASGTLQSNPRHVDIFFPKLFEFTHIQRWQFNIYLICLTFCEKDLMLPHIVEAQLPNLLEEYDKSLAIVLDKARWMEDDPDTYDEMQQLAPLLLDIIGYARIDSNIEKRMYAALSQRHPKLKLIAAHYLLRNDYFVDANTLRDVVHTPENRTWFYIYLERINKLDQYPLEFFTVEAFAEAELAEWLMFHFYEPYHNIELLHRAGFQSDQGTVSDFYIYRFRSNPPHWAAEKGWLVGWVGPVERNTTPQPLARKTSAFSKFDAYRDDYLDKFLERMSDLGYSVDLAL